MKHESRVSKIAVDMYTAQIQWTAWYLGITLLIYLVQLFFRLKTDGIISGFYFQISLSGNIYMFVIGIISGYAFLKFYVQNGVTRKEFFKGATLAALGLCVTIPIIAVVISLLEFGIVNSSNLPLVFDSPIDIRDEDSSNFIARTILSFLSSPFAESSSSWTLILIGTMFNYFFHYVCGWMISSGFYSKGVITGLSIIALVIVFFNVSFYLTGLPLILLLGLFGLIVLVGIRLLTRNVTVKL